MAWPDRRPPRRRGRAMMALGRGAALAAAWLATAGADAAPEEMSLDAFLEATRRGNLDLRAQAQEAQAAGQLVSAARVFPEPALSAGLGAWDPDGVQPLGYLVGLSQTLEVGGKRRARLAAARANARAADDGLADAWRLLRADAAQRFATALALAGKVARMQRTQEALTSLVRVNEERQRAGDIGEVAVRQSRVEATHFRAEVIAQSAELAGSRLALSSDVGDALPADRVPFPTGSLLLSREIPSAADLIAAALARRPDLAAAASAEAAAEADLGLAQANRWEDVTVQVSWLHSPPNGNLAYAQPPHLLTLTAGLPLPIARIYTGARDAARTLLAARHTARRALARQATVEVEAARTLLAASVRGLELYTDDLLADADAVAEATAYSYRRGAASLLEVLAAQRTLNEVALGYIDAQLGHVVARIGVERATGGWALQLAGAPAPP